MLVLYSHFTYINKYVKSLRPEYGRLVDLPNDFPGIPVMALTATATPATKRSLTVMLRHPVSHVGSVSKPNISLKAIELPSLFPKPGNLIIKSYH